MPILSILILLLAIKFFFELIPVDPVLLRVVNFIVLIGLVVCFIFSLKGTTI